jgi:hypothetical protein
MRYLRLVEKSPEEYELANTLKKQKTEAKLSPNPDAREVLCLAGHHVARAGWLRRYALRRTHGIA